METITSHYTASKELIWNELWLLLLLHFSWRTNCDGQTVLLCSQVRGWRSTDSCSCILCWQTEHLSCCAGFDRRARDRWSRCRRPRPLSSPPPLGWRSSRLGWNAALGLWRTPVQEGLRWEKKTRKHSRHSLRRYLMMLLDAKVEPCDFIAKRAVSAQVSCPDLKRSHRNCSAPRTTEKRATVFHTNRGTHLWTSKMPEVVEPVHVGPTVVKGVNELMRDHSVHVGLLVDVVLTQDDLRARGNVKHPGCLKCLTPQDSVPTCEEAASKPPLTVPSQFSQVKCRSFNTLLHREGKDFSITQHETKYSHSTSVTRRNRNSVAALPVYNEMICRLNDIKPYVPSWIFHGIEKELSIRTWETCKRPCDQQFEPNILICWQEPMLTELANAKCSKY